MISTICKQFVIPGESSSDNGHFVISIRNVIITAWGVALNTPERDRKFNFPPRKSYLNAIKKLLGFCLGT